MSQLANGSRKLFSRPTLDLLRSLIRREVLTRYSGSSLGVVWAWIGPLLMLGIYAFVFGNIFRPGSQNLGAPSYLLFVASALWPWMMFSEGLMRGMNAIHANGSLVRKIAFPHSVLVLSAVVGTVALHLVGYLFVLGGIAYFAGGISLLGLLGAVSTIFWMLVFTLGLAFFLAALHTIVRDVEQAVAPALTMLYFLTPVLYPSSVIPLPYRDWLNWNPLALMVTRLRQHLFDAPSLQFIDLLISLCAVGTLLAGALFFSRLSAHFEEFV